MNIIHLVGTNRTRRHRTTAKSEKSGQWKVNQGAFLFQVNACFENSRLTGHDYGQV